MPNGPDYPVDYQNVRNNFILGGDQDNEKNNHEGFRYMVFIFVCYRCQEPILTAQLFLSFLIMPWGSSEIYYFLLSVYQFPLSIKQNPVLDEGGGI